MKKVLIGLVIALISIAAIIIGLTFAVNAIDCYINGIHNWNGYTVINEATCTDEGLKERECSVCGTTESEIIPAHGHKMKKFTTYKESTCVSEGEMRSTCEYCDYYESQPTALGNHSYEGDNCIYCGCTHEKYFGYGTYDDGTTYVSLHGYGDDDFLPDEIIVPEIINGRTVTKFNFHPDEDHSKLISITLPKTVVEIAEPAFKGCTNLKSLTVLGDCTYISLIGCNSLSYVNVPAKLMKYVPKASLETAIINSGDKIESDYFKNASKLRSVTIADSVTSIAYGSFTGCSSLESITMPFVDYVGSIDTDSYRGDKGHYPFGYIFGSASYEGSVLTRQYLYVMAPIHGYEYELSYFYVPESLKNITITSGEIARRAFYNFSGVESITVGKDVTLLDEYAFYGCQSLVNVEILSDDVESIKPYTFYGCTALTDISLPNNIKSIGNYAFYGCASISDLTLPNGITSLGDYTFYGCTALKKISIPKNVSSIGKYTFYNCGLESLNIPDNITFIDDYAFVGCKDLIEIVLPDSICEIGKGTFNNTGYYDDESNWIDGVLYVNNHLIKAQRGSISGSYTVKEGTRTISPEAFYNCTALTGIVMPDSVVFIGQNAFKNAKIYTAEIPTIAISHVQTNNLRRLTIISGTEIENYALQNCTNLTTVTLNDEITYIGEGAFSGCSSLTEMVIPKSVTHIGYGAFSGCTSLSDAYVKNFEGWLYSNYKNGYSFLSEYGTLHFVNDEGIEITALSIPEGYGLVPAYAFMNAKNVYNVHLPDDVSYIAPYAFYGCTGLVYVNMPDKVYTIGERAFYGCRNLTDLSISQSTKTIGELAFYQCKGFSIIAIPDSVTTIGYGAFWGCSNVTLAKIGEGVTHVGAKAFESCQYLADVYAKSLESWLKIDFATDSTQSITSHPNVYAKLHFTDENGNELKELKIPEGVTAIQDNTFRNATNLTSVYIPEGVTHIGDNAFNNCTKITAVTLPMSLEYIGRDAFYGCTSLKDVTVYDISGWWVAKSSTATSGYDVNTEHLSNPKKAAELFVTTYTNYYWHKN